MTNKKPKALFNWSGGKDSALTLYKLQQSQEVEIACLLTSISQKYQRISMHGVRVDLLEAQTEQIGIPLVKMEVPDMPSMTVYEETMRNMLSELKKEGITASVFGDIFLEDLRTYRENKLAELDLTGVFPLWKQPTDLLIQEFLDLGFKTITTCVNEKYLDKSFVGRVIDEDFLKDLPANVDPCGENGEFHTFVYDGPIFSKPINFEKGEVVLRKYEAPKTEDDADQCFSKEKEDPTHYGFWYCDLIPL
ncbi:diphthine--ammonia ligase [Algoriphagus sp. D3-2-R+10]|uniref:Dph6-related ATP pyrophosphatase n=1 Tax=Algoriphagus aurantiacus TaxID=3103948 RepID=UPI002B3DA7FB|nr:diphthine--ammonia ligase [Algoriphagus sp. D3-2-R+10]MEB2776955.1 diphthine--ammonia ligase [Algoriphagus sp. D3-2-R+10]